jgi:RNA polymerase sigma-70 factor (ECF subfamily)
MTAIPTDFDDLLNAARSGDRGALNALFEAVRPCLRAWADELLPAQFQAKVASSDLVQESLTEAHAALPHFLGQTPAEFYGWLRSIQERNALSTLERFHRHKRNVRRERRLDDSPLPAVDQTPSAEAIAREQADRLTAALSRLPEEMRQVIELRQFQHQSYADVADRMGRTEAAVRKLFARAILRWKQEADAGP